MKACYTLLLAIGLSVVANAQPALKSTGTILRLKAIANYTSKPSGLEIFDSTQYEYSGDRAYNTKLKRWDYDSVMLYMNNSMIAKSRQVFDNNNNIVSADELQLKSNGLEVTSTYVFTHDPANSTIIRETYNPKNLKAGRKETMVWNQHGLENMLTQNKALAGHWIDSEKDTYTYNTGGYLTEIVNDNLANPATDKRFTYDYDAGNKLKTVTVAITTTGNWNITYRNTYDYAGNIVTDTRQNYNGTSFENSRQQHITYNAYDLPEKAVSEAWNQGAWKMDGETLYYYEIVFPTDIKDQKTNNTALQLYPVPAAHTLIIEITKQQQLAMTFAIYSMDGKVLRQWNQYAAGKQYKEIISIADLPSGNYILKAISDEGEISRQFQVAR